MRIDLQEHSTTVVSVMVEPGMMRGSRSTFGPLLHIGMSYVFESPRRPFLFEGTLRWGGETTGITIPLQMVVSMMELTVSLSDHQVDAIERSRAGKEPVFQLELRALDGPGSDGQLRWYRSPSQFPLMVPREVWQRAIDGFGSAGTFRIVELPAAPPARSPQWARAQNSVASAAQQLAAGRFGESVATSRTALERIAEALGEDVGAHREDTKTPIGSYIDRLARQIAGDAPRQGNDFAVLGQLMKSLNAWASEPVHQGFDVSERDEATFALNLCVALYSYFVRLDPPSRRAK